VAEVHYKKSVIVECLRFELSVQFSAKISPLFRLFGSPYYSKIKHIMDISIMKNKEISAESCEKCNRKHCITRSNRSLVTK
jgi:hypothetical protein